MANQSEIRSEMEFESEKTKISDSAYSNSCSNSNSQSSASSKSQRSGSHSSGSSGYCGNDESREEEFDSGQKARDNGASTQSMSLGAGCENWDSSAGTIQGHQEAQQSTTNLPFQRQIITSKKHQVPQIKRIRQNKKPKIVVRRRSKIRNAKTKTTKKVISKNTMCISHQQTTKLLQEVPIVHGNGSPIVLTTLEYRKEDEDHSNGISSINIGDQIIKNELPSVEKQIAVPYKNEGTNEESTEKILEEMITIPCNEEVNTNQSQDGFCCIISMCDGVVLYTTPNITNVLGFPKDMWLGRSFTDFIHPKDRDTFSNKITTGVAIPFINGVGKTKDTASSLYVCLKKYNAIKCSTPEVRNTVSYQAFNLTLTFRRSTKYSMGNSSDILLLIVAVPVYSSYTVPDEVRLTKKFGMRHTAACTFSHVDADVVMHFGYLPQDMLGRSVFDFYHPEDMPFLKDIYESVISNCQIAGSVYRSKPYRFAAHNGDFVMIETEWSCFINPWSRRLEFIIGLHRVLQGPNNPDVFESPNNGDIKLLSDKVLEEAKATREEILVLLNKELLRPSDVATQGVSKRCKDLATFMETIVDEVSLASLKIDTSKDYGLSFSEFHERDSVLLGEISPHHHSDDRESSDTPPSYNQLNYNENINRFFKSKPKTTESDESGEMVSALLCVADIDQRDKSATNALPSKQTCLSPIQASGMSASDSAGNLSSGSNLVGSGTTVSVSNDFYRPRHLTEAVLHRHNEDMEKIMQQRHKELKSSNKHDRDTKKGPPQILGAKRIKLSLDENNTKLAMAGSIAVPCNDNDCTFLRKHGAPVCVSTHNRINVCSGDICNKNTYQPKNAANVWSSLSAPFAQLNTNNGFASCNSNSFNNVATTSMMPVYCMPPQPHHELIDRTQNTNPQYQVQYMPGMLYNHNPVFTTSPFFCPPMTMVPVSFQQPTTPTVPECPPIKTVPCSSKSNPVTKFQGPASQATSVKAEPGSIHGSIASASIANRAISECSRNNIGPPSDCSPDSPLLIPNDCDMQEAIMASNKNNENISTVTNTTSQDESSSYSSFYSSFLKTDTTGSGSNDDWSSGVPKSNHCNSMYNRPRKCPIKKCDPPWMEAVSVTPELIYRYQLPVTNLEAVLQSDLKALKDIDQPMLVNDQLDQLYVELELDGLSAKLALEEGLTSSSSSGEDSLSNCPNKIKKRRTHSSLMMIYEGDAPFPPTKSY